MEVLSGNLPLILCALVGFILMVVEAFIPGFGIAGTLGIILEVIAVYLGWLYHGATFALVMTAIIIVMIAGTIFLSYRSVKKGRLSNSALVLKDEESPAPEPAAKSLLAYQQQEGVTVSALRPGGTVEIGGVRVNAASGGELIEKGTKVLVLGAEGDHVIVRPV